MQLKNSNPQNNYGSGSCILNQYEMIFRTEDTAKHADLAKFWILYQSIAVVECLWHWEEIYAIDAVESLCEVAGFFQILFLVFSYRDVIRLVDQDVGCHQSRVGEETSVDVVRLLAHFLFEGGDAFEFANICVHV